LTPAPLFRGRAPDLLAPAERGVGRCQSLREVKSGHYRPGGRLDRLEPGG